MTTQQTTDHPDVRFKDRHNDVRVKIDISNHKFYCFFKFSEITKDLNDSKLVNYDLIIV